MGVLTLNQLRYGRFNSALVRKCLSYYFREGVAYRVRFGPIRGMNRATIDVVPAACADRQGTTEFFVGSILSTKPPLLWIESHTPAEDRTINDTLAAQDDCAYRFTDRRAVVHPDRTHPDPDGVWGTLLLYPREHHRRIAEAL